MIVVHRVYKVVHDFFERLDMASGVEIPLQKRLLRIIEYRVSQLAKDFKLRSRVL